MFRILFLIGLIASASQVTPALVYAGGGPENVVVIVNGQSTTSRRIANHYAALRQIPSSNIIVLDDAPLDDVITVDEFREDILKPVFAKIVERRLQAQVDCVIYSTDFPTAIKVDSDIAQLEQKPPQIYTPVASINGLTYLYGLTLGENAAYLQMEINNYYQSTADEACLSPFLGEEGEGFEQAIKSYERGNFDDALEKFVEFDVDNPGYAAAAIWSARCHAQLKQNDELKASLETAIRLGWRFKNDTLLDPAFEEYREEEWFSEMLAQLPDVPRGSRPTQAFQSNQLWAPKGMPVGRVPIASKYMMSCVLACTRHEFMSEEEVIEMLERSVASDYSHPKGTFYFTKTSDVRTTTRQGGFDNAIADLARLGYESAISNDRLPINLKDVVGMMLGAATFDWEASGNEMVPGAIVENLTSFGGVLHTTRGDQTRLTELLRGGAAGSSGTVTEPYAIQNKFPHAYLQVHYARGSTLIEAFYQSIYGPYQLLIVGDALCQPFATPPAFEIEGLEEGKLNEVKGPVALTTDIETEDSIHHFDLYIDGRRAGQLKPEIPIRFDSSNLPDGYHELRVVAVGNTPVATTSRKIFPMIVDNNDEMIEFDLSNEGRANLDGVIFGTATAKGASKIYILSDSEIVAEIDGEEGAFDFRARSLGLGPVRLRATAKIGENEISSAPEELLIFETPKS